MSIFDPIYTDGEIDTKLKSLILNRLTKDEFDSMSAHSPDEIWFIQDSELSGQPIVVDTRPVEIPTKLSEFQNDVPYLSAVSWSQVTDKPTIPTQTSQLTNDSGFVTTADVEEEVADKRDYDDLTYNDKTVRAPTYGIGKMIATPSDGTDPVVMSTFFIHKHPSDPSDNLGSTWYAPSFVFAGTTDGTNFRMVDISFQTLATFTKTQLLAGEVTFTYQDKTWTLTAELGDGMVEKFDIWINSTKWTTSHYDYDSQTKTSKWWFQDNGWFLTRSWTSSGSLFNFWQASLYRGDDGVHGNVLVDRANVGGTAGYRAGGYVPSVTYGDYTQSIQWQVAGYPCQGTFGFSECVPTRNSQLVNDSQFVRRSEISALQYTGIDLEEANRWPSFQHRGIRTFTLSLPDYPGVEGELVLSASSQYGDVVSYWGNLYLTGNNMYVKCLRTGAIEGQYIYQFTLNKGSLASHQTIHTFSSEEIAAGVAPFQFTENDVTYDGVVSAEFATTRLATVNDISNHAVVIDGQAFLLNAAQDQYLTLSKIPVTIEQDFSYDSNNYTFEWYDGSNTQYWNTNSNSKSMGVGTLTIMLPADYTIGECFSWAINQGFTCEYCVNGATYYGSLSSISSNPLSTYPYLRIVIGA